MKTYVVTITSQPPSVYPVFLLRLNHSQYQLPMLCEPEKIQEVVPDGWKWFMWWRLCYLGLHWGFVFQVWHNILFHVASRDVKMAPWYLNELNFSSFIQGFQANPVFSVQLGLQDNTMFRNPKALKYSTLTAKKH